jgi:predicted DNA-binding transcriptional regulator AlpA
MCRRKGFPLPVKDHRGFISWHRSEVMDWKKK